MIDRKWLQLVAFWTSRKRIVCHVFWKSFNRKVKPKLVSACIIFPSISCFSFSISTSYTHIHTHQIYSFTYSWKPVNLTERNIWSVIAVVVSLCHFKNHQVAFEFWTQNSMIYWTFGNFFFLTPNPYVSFLALETTMIWEKNRNTCIVVNCDKNKHHHIHFEMITIYIKYKGFIVYSYSLYFYTINICLWWNWTLFLLFFVQSHLYSFDLLGIHCFIAVRFTCCNRLKHIIVEMFGLRR